MIGVCRLKDTHGDMVEGHPYRDFPLEWIFMSLVLESLFTSDFWLFQSVSVNSYTSLTEKKKKK